LIEAIAKQGTELPPSLSYLRGLIKGEKELMALTKDRISVPWMASYVRRRPSRLS